MNFNNPGPSNFQSSSSEDEDSNHLMEEWDASDAIIQQAINRNNALIAYYANQQNNQVIHGGSVPGHIVIKRHRSSKQRQQNASFCCPTGSKGLEKQEKFAEKSEKEMVRFSKALLKEVGNGINKTLSEFLVCPLSKQPLRYCQESNSLISDAIGVSYPIKDGIPCLVPMDGKILETDNDPKQDSDSSLTDK